MSLFPRETFPSAFAQPGRRQSGGTEIRSGHSWCILTFLSPKCRLKASKRTSERVTITGTEKGRGVGTTELGAVRRDKRQRQCEAALIWSCQILLLDPAPQSSFWHELLQFSKCHLWFYGHFTSISARPAGTVPEAAFPALLGNIVGKSATLHETTESETNSLTNNLSDMQAAHDADPQFQDALLCVAWLECLQQSAASSLAALGSSQQGCF